MDGNGKAGNGNGSPLTDDEAMRERIVASRQKLDTQTFGAGSDNPHITPEGWEAPF
jgi:hypothetical protein